MRKEIKTVVYDDELHIEAYRFEGIGQPFSNHFHYGTTLYGTSFFRRDMPPSRT